MSELKVCTDAARAVEIMKSMDELVSAVLLSTAAAAAAAAAATGPSAGICCAGG